MSRLWRMLFGSPAESPAPPCPHEWRWAARLYEVTAGRPVVVEVIDVCVRCGATRRREPNEGEA